MLMAEFFLARTRSGVVNQVFSKFVNQFPDIETLHRADEEEIADIIRPTGLQNRRASSLKEIAAELNGGEIPRDPQRLQELPRIGPYVSNAALCFGMEEPLPIIDTNVRRVYERVLGDEWPDDEEEEWEMAGDILPEDEARMYNLALLDFGSEICSAQSPSCESCFASEYCSYYQNRENEVETDD